MTIPFIPPANTPVNGVARIRAVQPQTAGKTEGKAATANIKAGGTVELSAQAQQLQHISARLSAQPVVDQSRVERLREAIENGSYRIDSKLTASNLLAFERDL